MELFLEEYQHSLKAAKKIRETAPEEDQKIFAGIIGDLEYTVKWLKNKRMPEPAKSRVCSIYSEINAIELFEYESATLFYSDPFIEVEEKIDRERSRNRFGRS